WAGCASGEVRRRCLAPRPATRRDAATGLAVNRHWRRHDRRTASGTAAGHRHDRRVRPRLPALRQLAELVEVLRKHSPPGLPVVWPLVAPGIYPVGDALAAQHLASGP